MNRFVVISGCSGGGKSTLLAEMARRGYAVVDEPGRRIVAEELAGEGRALPWNDMAAFARRAVAMALTDWAAAHAHPGRVFFDRGLIDAASALGGQTGQAIADLIGPERRYHKRVFLTPPWLDIYVTDPGRRHSFSDALAEYNRLVLIYPALGYDMVLLPKSTVEERADFILSALADHHPPLRPSNAND